MKKKIIVKQKMYALNEVVLEGNEEDIDKVLNFVDEYQDFDTYVDELSNFEDVTVVSVERGEPEPDEECEAWDSEVIEE